MGSGEALEVQSGDILVWEDFERYSEQFGCFLEPFGLILTILAWLGKDPRTSTSWVRLPVHLCTERYVLYVEKDLIRDVIKCDERRNHELRDRLYSAWHWG